MLYNFGIYCYGIFLKTAALFHPKAKKWVAGRKSFWENLPETNNKKVIWFHCASLGEYDQGKPIMEKWKEKYPNDFLLITFFSPSGYEYIKEKSVGDFTCYLPLDTPNNARRFVAYFKPETTFFIKYEIWINYIKEVRNIQSKIYLISAVFRENHRFFKWYGKNFLTALLQFNSIFVQNEKAKKIIEKYGAKNVFVSGDTRYDRVVQRVRQDKENPIISTWLEDEKAFVIGSSWPLDENKLMPLINHDFNSKVILAPHEIDRKHIEEIVEQLTVSFQLYTKIQQGEGKLKSTTTVLVLDCIGVLAEAYKYGKIAYIGGGFGTGLHNILEPAAFGLPVIFGPQHQKFPEAQTFIDAGIGKSCFDFASLKSAYSFFENQPLIQQKVKNFVAQKTGATEMVFSKVVEDRN